MYLEVTLYGLSGLYLETDVSTHVYTYMHAIN